MTLNGLVSVIITNYNYEKYVGFAIDSARSQTWSDIEILVVDDGSTDGSWNIIADRARIDSRLRIFFQKNSGQAAATNRGILEARGEFVAFLDADDIWCPDKIERQVPLFKDPDVGVVYSAAWLIDADGKEYKLLKTNRIEKSKSFLHHIILENFIPFSSAVVRRRCFARAGLLNPLYRVCTDYDLWLRMAKFYKFDCVLDPLIGYRANPNSLSGNPIEMKRVAREITDLFYQQNKSLFDANFIRMERKMAMSARVYHFSKTGHLFPALSNMLKLFLIAPFSLATLKSLYHIALMVKKRRWEKRK